MKNMMIVLMIIASFGLFSCSNPMGSDTTPIDSTKTTETKPTETTDSTETETTEIVEYSVDFNGVPDTIEEAKTFTPNITVEPSQLLTSIVLTFLGLYMMVTIFRLYFQVKQV